MVGKSAAVCRQQQHHREQHDDRRPAARLAVPLASGRGCTRDCSHGTGVSHGPTNAHPQPTADAARRLSSLWSQDLHSGVVLAARFSVSAFRVLDGSLPLLGRRGSEPPRIIVGQPGLAGQALEESGGPMPASRNSANGRFAPAGPLHHFDVSTGAQCPLATFRARSPGSQMGGYNCPDDRPTHQGTNHGQRHPGQHPSTVPDATDRRNRRQRPPGRPPPPPPTRHGRSSPWPWPCGCPEIQGSRRRARA